MTDDGEKKQSRVYQKVTSGPFRDEIIYSVGREEPPDRQLRWFHRPFGIILLTVIGTVIAGLLVAWTVYRLGWNH